MGRGGTSVMVSSPQLEAGNSPVLQVLSPLPGKPFPPTVILQHNVCNVSMSCRNDIIIPGASHSEPLVWGPNSMFQVQFYHRFCPQTGVSLHDVLGVITSLPHDTVMSGILCTVTLLYRPLSERSIPLPASVMSLWNPNLDGV